MTSAHSPTIFYADCTYEITLTRNAKTTRFTFGEHAIAICASREDELSQMERSQIKGPCAEDGLVYYIRAEPYDFGGAPFFVWLKDEEEALALNSELRAMEEEEANDDSL
jgi:hypothetical protein